MSYERYCKYVVLMILLGWLGVHRFATGKTKTGILYLITFGMFGFGVLYDIFMLTMGRFKDKEGKAITSEFSEKPIQNALVFMSPVFLIMAAFFVYMFIQSGDTPSGADPLPSPSCGLSISTITPLTYHSEKPSPVPSPTIVPSAMRATASATPVVSPFISPTATAEPQTPTPAATSTPIPKPVKYKITYKSVKITENGKIGNEWTIAVMVNGAKLARNKTATVQLLPSDILEIVCTATEQDKRPDEGITTQEYTPANIKTGTVKIIVEVTENAGRKSGHSTVWEFTFDIKKG